MEKTFKNGNTEFTLKVENSLASSAEIKLNDKNFTCWFSDGELVKENSEYISNVTSRIVNALEGLDEKQKELALKVLPYMTKTKQLPDLRSMADFLECNELSEWHIYSSYKEIGLKIFKSMFKYNVHAGILSQIISLISDSMDWQNFLNQLCEIDGFSPYKGQIIARV